MTILEAVGREWWRLSCLNGKLFFQPAFGDPESA